MKTIKVKWTKTFKLWRDLGREQYAKTPKDRRANKLTLLAADAIAEDAGDEEQGLLVGFLEAHDDSGKDGKTPTPLKFNPSVSHKQIGRIRVVVPGTRFEIGGKS